MNTKKDKKRLAKIIQSMTDNIDKNVAVIEKHMDFLLNWAKESNLVESVFLLNKEKVKIRLFLIKFLEIISQEEYDEIIIKRDINGNNIFHLVAEKGEYAKLLNDLIHIERKRRSWLFYNKVPYNFYNNRNKNGMKFFDLFLNKKIEMYEDGDGYGYIDLIRTIGNDDIGLIIDNHDLILKKVDEFNVLPGYEDIKDMSAVLSDLYYDEVIQITELFSDYKEENIELIKKVFGDVNYTKNGYGLLWQCILAYDQINEEAFCKLLEVGVNPNLKNKDGHTFIEYAMTTKWISNHDRYPNITLPTIIFLLEKSIEYGFDVNQKPNIMSCLIDNYGFSKTTLDVYQFLCNHGFKSQEFDRMFWIYVDNFSGDKEIKNEIIDFHKKQVITEQIMCEINNNRFAVSEEFKNKLVNVFNDIWDSVYELQNMVDSENNGKFANILVSNILESKKNSVNCSNNMIDILDILDGMRQIIINKQNDILDDINKCKIKQLNN